jgi:hypothetical protein
MNSRRRFRTSETRSSSWCQCCARHQTIAKILPPRQRSEPSLLRTSRRNSAPRKIATRYSIDSRTNAIGHPHSRNSAHRTPSKLRLCLRSSRWTRRDENRRNRSSRLGANRRNCMNWMDAKNIRASRRMRRHNLELTIVRRRKNTSLRRSSQRESFHRHGHCRRSSASHRLHLRGIRHHRETRHRPRRDLRLRAGQTQERAQK